MNKGIWIITDETVEVEGSKNAIDIGANYVISNQGHRHRSLISAADLKQNIGEFTDVIEQVFERADNPVAKLQLEEIELSIEISGNGRVNLLGMGAEAAAKGAVKLKFKRKND